MGGNCSKDSNNPPMEMEELRRSWIDQKRTIKKQSIIIDSLKQELLELKDQRENQPNDLEIWSDARRLQEEERVLPTTTRLALANARKQILAPLVANIEVTRDRINGIEEDSKSCSEGNIRTKSKLKLRLEEAKVQLKKDKSSLKDAKEEFNRCVVESAAEISLRLIKQAQQYDDLMNELYLHEPGVMTELLNVVGDIVNHGELKKGDKVELEIDGVMKKAKVENVCADDKYDLKLWTEVITHGTEYEEGYDISEKYQQRAYAIARSKLTRAGGKDEQPIPLNAPTDPQDPNILAYIYEEAARTKIILDETVAEAVEAVNNMENNRCEAITAPLKSQHRAILKCVEKYKGNFTRLTDIARTTIKCSTLSAVYEVIRWISTNKKDVVAILRIKNRLNPAFDASLAGGYRDILMNVRFVETKHIAEIQITLEQLLEVKNTGGHEIYEIARLLNLNDPTTMSHEGAGHTDVLKKVANGVIRSLVLDGTEIDENILEDLRKSLMSKTCVLTKLCLSGCKGDIEGSDFESFCTPEIMNQLASTLNHLDLSNLNLVGKFPTMFWEKFKNIEHIDLSNNNFTTCEIPGEVGGLKKLRTLLLYGNKGLTGPIPIEFGKLKKLEYIILGDCCITGSIPADLGELVNLKRLTLIGNQDLTGPIPKELGNLKKLEELYIQNCNLNGSIPAELGELLNVKKLYLFGNQDLTGPIPKELGNLKKLEELYIQNCNLNGSIPAELGKLVNLKKLYLFGNKDLTGPIPKELGNLKKLREFDVSDCNLNGSIPAEHGVITRISQDQFRKNLVI